jgi:serine/threonine protein kinase
MEVQILKAVKCVKGIAQIVDHGVSSTGLLYIVMERYGRSLKDMLRHSKYERFSIKTSV